MGAVQAPWEQASLLRVQVKEVGTISRADRVAAGLGNLPAANVRERARRRVLPAGLRDESFSTDVERARACCALGPMADNGRRFASR